HPACSWRSSASPCATSSRTSLFKISMEQLEPILKENPILATILSYAGQTWQRSPDFDYRAAGGQALSVVRRPGARWVLVIGREFCASGDSPTLLLEGRAVDPDP